MIVWKYEGYWTRHSDSGRHAEDGCRSAFYTIFNPYWMVEAVINWLAYKGVFSYRVGRVFTTISIPAVLVGTLVIAAVLFATLRGMCP